MAISTEYRLPGVYSVEKTGIRMGTISGGNATVAFVGPALGYLSATQRMTLTDTDAVALNNGGVIGSSVVVTSRANGGVTYTANGDYSVTVADGATKIARKISTVSSATPSVADATFTGTFAVAQPSFSILVEAAAGKYIIANSVSASYVRDGGSSVALVYGTDYEISFTDQTADGGNPVGWFTAKAAGALDNGDVLTVTYKYTNAEPVPFIGTSWYQLSKPYIVENGVNNKTAIIGTFTGSTFNAGSYTEGIDYTVDTQNGFIRRTNSVSNIPAFVEEDLNYQYLAYGYCGIHSGDTVYVSYNYTDSTYYDAKWFDDYNTLAAYYGQGWDATTGEIVSPLTVAAYFATRNGLAGCYAVAVEGTSSMVGEGYTTTYTPEAWANAFDALTVVDGIDIVVPITGNPTYWNLAISHINQMQDNEDERIVILGADGTTSGPIAPATMISYANGFNNGDVWMVSPSTFRATNIVTGDVDIIPGYYAAAAVAGYNSSVPQYTPLTHKVISGLYSANEYLTKAVKKNESANGLMYIDENGATMRILHGRTTSTNAIVEQETNIVLTKYYIIKTMRRVFNNGYVGGIITDATLASLKSIAHATLCNLRDADFMTGFNGLSVTADSSNPTQVNIAFSYRPTYAMSYIEITFSIDAN